MTKTETTFKVGDEVIYAQGYEKPTQGYYGTITGIASNGIAIKCNAHVDENDVETPCSDELIIRNTDGLFGQE